MWHTGTIGFSYAQWQGVFYPTGLKAERRLVYYSQIFNSVEIDSTFYGTPTAASVQRWAQSVGEGFLFCPKTPRAITHDGRCRDHEGMAHFVDTMRLLGPHLGPILIQLPPDCTADEQAAVDAFLRHLSRPDLRLAIEFRHRSWAQPATAAWLRELGVAWVGADYIIMPKVVNPTADFLYLRFLGEHGRYATKNSEQRDPTADLRHWHSQIQAVATPPTTVFAFFNNDFAGYSPQSAQRWLAETGEPLVFPHQPTQGRLFG